MLESPCSAMREVTATTSLCTATREKARIVTRPSAAKNKKLINLKKEKKITLHFPLKKKNKPKIAKISLCLLCGERSKKWEQWMKVEKLLQDPGQRRQWLRLVWKQWRERGRLWFLKFICLPTGQTLIGSITISDMSNLREAWTLRHWYRKTDQIWTPSVHMWVWFLIYSLLSRPVQSAWWPLDTESCEFTC